MAKPKAGGRNPQTRTARDQDPTVISGGTSEQETFLGGFPAGFEVPLPEASRPGDAWRGDPRPLEDPGRTTTLDELREAEAGGYMSTDVWGPQNESPGVIAQLQTLLVEAGLLNEDDLTSPGYYDEKTMAAYRDLLGRANAFGTNWEDALTRLRSNPAARLASMGKKSAPKLRRVTNPDDLRSVFKQATRRYLGFDAISDQDIDKMVQSYQGLEVQAQDAESGTVADPPSLETFAEQQVRSADPVGFDAHQAIDGFDMLVQFMQGATPNVEGV